MTLRLTHLVVGPERHGVVRFGVELDARLRTLGHRTVLRRSVEGVDGGGVHVQFTDRPFGRTPPEAAAAVTRIADDVHQQGRRMTVTLHDVPQPSDGTWFADRVRCYAQVCAVADGIVVSSEHERQLLSENAVSARQSSVIPLPIAAPASRMGRDAGQRTVGVFGFLYPGKGHLEVLDAMSGLAPSIAMTAIGEPSAGHQELVEQLTQAAQRTGRLVDVTGHVADADLTATLQAVAVPVAHHRHVSASGSLNAWLAAGRRPLVPRTRYTEEIARRNPGCVTLYRDEQSGLAQAIAEALAHPESTWLPPGASCQPSERAAALRYAEVLTGWHQ